MDIIRAYGRCCAASGVAELASLLDDQSLYPIPDGTLVSISSVAAVALLECVIVRPGAGAKPGRIGERAVSAGTARPPPSPVRRTLGGEVQVRPFEDDVCFDVALLFAQDLDRSVRDEGYAIFKRSQRQHLSRRTVEAVGLLATSLREEVREIACRMIKQCFKNPSKYFKSCEDARDLAYKRTSRCSATRRIRPKPCTSTLVDPMSTRSVIRDRHVRRRPPYASPPSRPRALPPAGNSRALPAIDASHRCPQSPAGRMLYDPVEAVRDAAADGLRYTHGGLWLRKLDYGQPPMTSL